MGDVQVEGSGRRIGCENLTAIGKILLAST